MWDFLIFIGATMIGMVIGLFLASVIIILLDW